MSASKGLHAGEIDCLLSRALTDDQHPSLDRDTRASSMIRLHGIRWLGVFARDELPDVRKEQRPFALVLNTDPRSKPGQHWLALFGPPDGPIELFDSFGLAPSVYNLAHLSPTHSRIQFQSSNSAYCGHYCIYFLYHRSHSRCTIELGTFTGIVEWLRKMHVPDHWVHRYVETLQRTYRVINPCNRTGQCSKLKCSFC